MSERTCMAAMDPPLLVVKPTFSASVMRDTMSAARAATESEVLQKGRPLLMGFWHGGARGEPTCGARK